MGLWRRRRSRLTLVVPRKENAAIPTRRGVSSVTTFRSSQVASRGACCAYSLLLVKTCHARGAHAISVAGIGLDMKCSSKAEFGLPDRWVRVPVPASGNFRDFATIPVSGGSGSEITGGSDLFTGRLDRRRWTVTGTWDLKLAFQTSAGQSGTCDSGRVTFTAHQ